MFRQAEIAFPNSKELQALIKEIQQESARKKAAQITLTLENCLKELESAPRSKPFINRPLAQVQQPKPQTIFMQPQHTQHLRRTPKAIFARGSAISMRLKTLKRHANILNMR